ncbi:MAG: hypothetical protein IPN13_18250 [Bacteroidetes bacterium]|nr:hypothetical protein [Bacteroidota bacterium]
MLDVSGMKGFKLENERKNLVLAEPEEGRRVLSILQMSGSPVSFIGFVTLERVIRENRMKIIQVISWALFPKLSEIAELHA